VRLFVAVRPPPEPLADAAAAVEAVRPVGPGLRWVPPERWHLTLAFYGEVPDDELDRVVSRTARRLGAVADRRLEAVADRRPEAVADRRHDAAAGRRPAAAAGLRLALTGSGVFARRAVWLGVTGDVAPLRAIAAALDPGGRRYRPHLTVARVRDDIDPAPAVAALSGYAGPVWTAAAVHLVRSRPGPAPAYDDLATWPVPHRS
jgi:RNA 2',3'-cyclic 3'-phosphodiesterase